MAEPSQFGAKKPSISSEAPDAGKLDCAAVEALLTEAAEENLPPAIAKQLQGHVSGCPACQEKLVQARRGRDWLLVLKQEALQPPADLVTKILAQTAGAAELTPPGSEYVNWGLGLNPSSRPGSTEGASTAVSRRTTDSKFAGAEDRLGTVAPVSSPVPAWQRRSMAGVGRTLLESRMALVVAMAFFSVSLTLNLMGVRITKLRAADLAPQNMRRAITRQYAEANARVVRYYENLRIVYEVESRVQEMRRAAETSQPQAQSGSKPHQGSSDSSSDQSGQKELHRERMANNPGIPLHSHPQPAPVPILTGPRLEAALFSPPFRTKIAGGCLEAGLGRPPLALPFAIQLAPRASSCSLSFLNLSMRERRFA